MNYYKVLEVDREASPEVIQKAYKALSMKHHPDRQEAGDRGPEAHAKMLMLNEAYAVLSDPRKRQEYDSETMYWRVWIDDGLIGLAKAWLAQN